MRSHEPALPEPTLVLAAPLYLLQTGRSPSVRSLETLAAKSPS